MCECEGCKCTETNVLVLRIYIIGDELYSFCPGCDENH
jgi:hypothetical protein